MKQTLNYGWIETYPKPGIVRGSIGRDPWYEDAVIVANVRRGAASAGYAEAKPARRPRYADFLASLPVH